MDDAEKKVSQFTELKRGAIDSTFARKLSLGGETEFEVR
jgi:hypothetical protein